MLTVTVHPLKQSTMAFIRFLSYPHLFLIFPIMVFYLSLRHSYANDSTHDYFFHLEKCSFQQQIIKTESDTLSSDLSRIFNWGKDKMIVFNVLNTKFLHLPACHNFHSTTSSMKTRYSNLICSFILSISSLVIFVFLWRIILFLSLNSFYGLEYP